MLMPKNPHSHQLVRFLRIVRDGIGRGGVIRADGGGGGIATGCRMTGGGAEIGTCATVLSADGLEGNIAFDGTVASDDCCMRGLGTVFCMILSK